MAREKDVVLLKLAGTGIYPHFLKNLLLAQAATHTRDPFSLFLEVENTDAPNYKQTNKQVVQYIIANMLVPICSTVHDKMRAFKRKALCYVQYQT